MRLNPVLFALSRCKVFFCIISTTHADDPGSNPGDRTNLFKSPILHIQKTNSQNYSNSSSLRGTIWASAQPLISFVIFIFRCSLGFALLMKIGKPLILAMPSPFGLISTMSTSYSSPISNG